MSKTAYTIEEFKAQILDLENVLGEFHGKIGGHTIYRLNGKRVIRKNGKPSLPASPAQIEWRRKFAYLQKKGKEFYAIISKTLPMKNGKTPINQFISLNIHNVIVTEEGCFFKDKPIFTEGLCKSIKINQNTKNEIENLLRIFVNLVLFVVKKKSFYTASYKSRKGFFALPTTQNRIRYYNPTTKDFSTTWDLKTHSPPKWLFKFQTIKYLCCELLFSN